MPTASATDSRTLAALRRLLLALLVIGLIVTGTDLILLEHYEEATMLIPIVLIVVAMLTVLWNLIAPTSGSIRLLQVVMVAMVLSGLVGMALHYQGNLEFQREMNPTATRWEYFIEVIHAKAPPAIAPSAMAHLGLLGLAFAFRHPRLSSSSSLRWSSSSSEEV